MTTYGYRDDNLCFKSQIETPTSRRIQKARTALVLDHPSSARFYFD